VKTLLFIRMQEYNYTVIIITGSVRNIVKSQASLGVLYYAFSGKSITMNSPTKYIFAYYYLLFCMVFYVPSTSINGDFDLVVLYCFLP
jgi:hypothetical protein